VPKVGAVISTVPIEVLGGGVIVMFGMVVAAGISMLSDVKWNRRNMVIFATALSVGLGLQLEPEALQHLPDTAQVLLTSGLLPAAFIAIFLNLLLPEDIDDDQTEEIAGGLAGHPNRTPPRPRAAASCVRLRPSRLAREPTMPHVEPLAPALWPAFEDLFGKQGACFGCWCTYFRLPPAARRASTPERNREIIRARIAAGPPPGLLAFDEGRAVGWMQIGPRADVPEWNNPGRVSAPPDPSEAADPGVWAISCFFVRRGRAAAA
jgi:hypothetical protein